MKEAYLPLLSAVFAVYAACRKRTSPLYHQHHATPWQKSPKNFLCNYRRASETLPNAEVTHCKYLDATIFQIADSTARLCWVIIIVPCI